VPPQTRIPIGWVAVGAADRSQQMRWAMSRYASFLSRAHDQDEPAR